MKYPDVGREIEVVAAAYRNRETPDLLLRIQDVVANVLRWLADLLRSLNIEAPGLTDTSAVGDLMRFVLIAAGVGGAAVLIAVVWTRLSQLQSQALKARRGGTPSGLVLDADGWKVEAGRLAGAEEWRSACRALYLSLLRLLHERDIAPFSPTKTNYEYLYALTEHPAIRESFRGLTDCVESLWFGANTAQKQDYDYCLALIEKVELMVKGPGPPPPGAETSTHG